MNIFGVFCVKNNDFTPINHIFFNCGRRRENIWGISGEKSQFYAKKSYFFPILELDIRQIEIFRSTLSHTLLKGIVRLERHLMNVIPEKRYAH